MSSLLYLHAQQVRNTRFIFSVC
eukprot:COSAG06_NODE_34021_length_480_cov_98.223097_1_plen_22_part_01